MSIDILMPALSPTMEEGALARWLVKVGDRVKSGDVIAEIETDKATMEVEAADEGVVEALLVEEGAQEVKVNTPIARLEGEGGGAAPPPTPPSRRLPPEKGEEGEEARSSSSSSGGGGPPKAVEGASATRAAPPTAEVKGDRVFASPLAHRLAAKAGLDLVSISGSGPHGRILRRDVEAARAGTPPPAKPPSPPGHAPTPALATPPALAAPSLEQLGIAPGSYDLVKLDGMRRTVARRMTAAFRDVPHFPLSVDVEVDALIAARARLNAGLEKAGVKVSLNDLVIKAAAAALKRVPEANASFTPEGIALHHHADIAVAVAIDGGLITPIIRAAEAKGVAAIAAEMKDLAERARARKLEPREYQGGTFSLSNLGMFGVRSFASILNEPAGAILSVGAADRRPVVRDDALAIATVMSVTLTCDHRVVDGAIGARFLGVFKGMIEDPITMIA